MPPWRVWLGGLLVAVCLCVPGIASAKDAKKPAPRSGDLPAFAVGLRVDLKQDVHDLAVEEEGDVWLLTLGPDSFVRIDRDGRVAERIPFSWPNDLDRSNEYDRRFTVTTSGDLMLGKYRFGRDGRVRSVLPFQQAFGLAAGPDDTVFRLSEGGVEVYDRAGKLLRRFSEGGIGPGRIRRPEALAVDLGGRVVVAERTRLQLFDSRGRFLRAAELPEDLGHHPGLRIGSVAIDGRGYVYAAVDNGPVIAVFNPQLRYLGVLPAAETWSLWPTIAVDRQGSVLSLVGNTLLRSAPVQGSVHAARPLPEPKRENGKVRAATAVPLQPGISDNPRHPFRIHASTSNVNQVAADPRVRGRLWLGTGGGLVRYDPGTESWKHWSFADGLPGTEILSLQSDGRRVYIILRNLFAIFDTETETFRRMVLRGDGVESQGGLRILRDPADPGVFWWLLSGGVARQEVATGAWTFFRSPERLIDGVVFPSGTDGGRRLVGITRSQVWELRTDQSTWRLLTDVDVLDQASRKRYDPSLLVELHSLTADQEGRTFWLGSSRNGLFRLDAATGQVTWSAETERCWSSRGVRHQGQLLVMGSDCFREVGSCCAIQKESNVDFHTALPDPQHPEVLWLATSEGLHSYQTDERQFRRHRPRWSEPDGTHISALQVLDGRLWAAPMNRGLSVLDLKEGRWKIFSDLRNVQVVRRSAANGLLLSVDLYQSLTWIDPRTLEATSPLVGWKSLWSSLADVHHDERGLWGIGVLNGKDEEAFGLFGSDGTPRTWLGSTDSGDSPHRLLPDPSRPGGFWVVTGAGKLVRFQPKTGAAEVIRSGVEGIQIEDGRLWIQGFPNAVLDLQTGALAELGVQGEITPDPGHPDRIWHVFSNYVELCAAGPGERAGQRIAAIDLPDGWSYAAPVVIGERFFLGTSFGLLEAPFASLLPPAGSPPRHCM